jgi:hypothetical protein
MKLKFFSVVAALAVVMFMGPMAKADSCSGTAIALTVNNVGLTSTSVNFCAADNGDGTFDLTLEDPTNFPNSSTLFFINQFNWDGTASFDSDTSSSGWALPNGNATSFQADGFGKFNSEVDHTGNTGTVGTTIEFSGSIGDLGPIAVHAGSNTCTGWFTNAEDAETNSGGGACTPTSQVPEPGSLALFGTGLLGMAGFLRRKLMS